MDFSVWVGRKPPGFAFIEFEDRRDADDAIRALNGMSTFCLIMVLMYCMYLVTQCLGSPKTGGVCFCGVR